MSSSSKGFIFNFGNFKDSRRFFNSVTAFSDLKHRFSGMISVSSYVMHSLYSSKLFVRSSNVHKIYLSSNRIDKTYKQLFMQFHKKSNLAFCCPCSLSRLIS